MSQGTRQFAERRQRRSSDPDTAIGYQLDRVVDDFDLQCCLIVDGSGDVVASCPDGTDEKIRRFAAVLPSMCMADGDEFEAVRDICRRAWEVDASEVTGCVFRAGGRRMFIGAVGPRVVMNEVAIFRAITGTRRIRNSRAEKS